MSFADAAGPVLVVDDDEDIRESIGQVLEDLQREFLTARNGLDALIVARRTVPAPRLILLDLTMPVMSGWQFLEERQKDGALARIPVVVMTAAADSSINPVNVSAVLRKPLAYEELLQAINLDGGGN